MNRDQIVSAFKILMYIIGVIAVFTGVGMAAMNDDIYRDIGLFLITFSAALILIGLTQKKQ